MGDDFEGFGSKYAAVYPLLSKMNPASLVVISDGRDVLINNPMFDHADVSSAVSEFRSAYSELTSTYPRAIVVSAEAQCCVSALTHVVPGQYYNTDGTRNSRACASGEEGCLWAGEEKAMPWENFMRQIAVDRAIATDNADIYLNAGLMAGSASNLIRVIESAMIGKDEDDQAVLTDYMFLHPEEIVLDYGQTLFGNNRGGIEGTEEEKCVFDLSDEDSSSSMRLVHAKTGTSPLFLHSPGKFLECHDELAAKLGVVSEAVSTSRRLLEQSFEGRALTQNCNYGGTFVCPANSSRRPGRQCYDTINDCQCNPGFDLTFGQCLCLEIQCPANSSRRPGRSCYNTINDCACKAGFSWVNGQCVNRCNFQCPVNSTPKRNRQCYSSMDDCKCDQGFISSGIGCIARKPA